MQFTTNHQWELSQGVNTVNPEEESQQEELRTELAAEKWEQRETGKTSDDARDRRSGRFAVRVGRPGARGR